MKISYRLLLQMLAHVRYKHMYVAKLKYGMNIQIGEFMPD